MSNKHYKAEDIARLLSAMKLGRALVGNFQEQYEKAVAAETPLLDVLGTLLEEEIMGRQQRRFERLVKSGNLDMSDAMEHYDLDLGRKHGVKTTTVKELAQCDYIAQKRNIVLAGAVGSGKTKLARTLAFEAIRQGHTAIFERTREMIERLYQMRNSHLYPRVYKRYVTADLLALDDLAYMPFAPEQVDYLFRVVFDRIEKQTGPVIVTTNTDVKQWWRFFPSKEMGMAFSDRVLGGATGIKFTGPSIRHEPRKGKK